MERKRLDWAHLFKKTGCQLWWNFPELWRHFWFCCSSVLNAVVTSAVHSYTDMYSRQADVSFCGIKQHLKSLTCKQLLSVSNNNFEFSYNVKFYWLYSCPVIFFFLSFFLSFFLLSFFLLLLSFFFFFSFSFSFFLFFLSFLSFFSSFFFFFLSFFFFFLSFFLSCLFLSSFFFFLFYKLFMIIIYFFFYLFLLFFSLFFLLFIFCKVLIMWKCLNKYSD